MPSLARRFLDLNRRISRAADRALAPAAMRLDGFGAFNNEVLERLVAPGQLVYELGGGSQPFLWESRRAELGIGLIGLDISAEELAAAVPPHCYDRTIVADITRWRGAGDGDLVICRSTLEHVRDMDGALAGIASALKEGGRAALFMPCRNAPFAWLNRLLPERAKRLMLYAAFPEKAEGHDGFPAFYDRATPREIVTLAAAHGLSPVERRVFWMSDYFSVFFPAFLLWRAWTHLARALIGDNFCETFALVLEKRAA